LLIELTNIKRNKNALFNKETLGIFEWRLKEGEWA